MLTDPEAATVAAVTAYLGLLTRPGQATPTQAQRIARWPANPERHAAQANPSAVLGWMLADYGLGTDRIQAARSMLALMWAEDWAPGQPPR